MASENLVSIWVFLLFLYPVKSDLANGGFLQSEFVFNGFSDSAARNSMSLNGFAAFENNGMLRLTNDSLQVVGHAFYSYPIQFKNSSGEVRSFSTAFAFAVITAHEPGGDGLAFTISPTKELPGAAPGPYLGLFNASNDGNFSNHVFAVEFDTFKDPELHDLNDNHVGLDINSIVSKKSVPAMEFKGSDRNMSHMTDLDLKSGQVIQAWIEYNSQVNQLDVKVALDSSRPRSILLSSTVNLSDILQESMYIGFSASTGSYASSHYILGWSFNGDGGDAYNLYLDNLPQLSTGAKKNRTALIVGVYVLVALTVISVITSMYFLLRKTRVLWRPFLTDLMVYIRRWIYRDFLPVPLVDVLIDIGLRKFSYNELKKATGGFNDTQIIGAGGFGKVYRGTLPNTQVAVKHISAASKQGIREFLSEVSIIGRVHHRYLIQLLGWCCWKDKLLLVYEFMPNGSLDKHLFGEPETILSWEQRFRIIKNVASALSYLHEECDQIIVHRDIKPGNVLLDSEFNGKLGDFGLAKLYERHFNGSLTPTRMMGTLGYMAPELTYADMPPTTSSDVFSFGALLLEVVCGRRPVMDPTVFPKELMLVDWVSKKWSLGEILDVVDPRLEGTFDPGEARFVLELGMICSNRSPEARPTMIQVGKWLDEGAELDVLAGKKLKKKVQIINGLAHKKYKKTSMGLVPKFLKKLVPSLRKFETDPPMPPTLEV